MWQLFCDNELALSLHSSCLLSSQSPCNIPYLFWRSLQYTETFQTPSAFCNSGFLNFLLLSQWWTAHSELGCESSQPALVCLFYLQRALRDFSWTITLPKATAWTLQRPSMKSHPDKSTAESFFHTPKHFTARNILKQLRKELKH